MGDELATVLLACGDKCDSHGERLAWPVPEIIERNQRMRSDEAFHALYMPFDHLLFFGGAGDGDLFALPIDRDSQVRRYDVFRWRHESDERVWYAGGAVQYVANRLKHMD